MLRVAHGNCRKCNCNHHSLLLSNRIPKCTFRAATTLYHIKKTSLQFRNISISNKKMSGACVAPTLSQQTAKLC